MCSLRIYLDILKKMKGIISQEYHILGYVHVGKCVCVYEIHITGFKKYRKYGINEALSWDLNYIF